MKLASELARNHKLYLFPVNADKTPATAHGFKDASDDPVVLDTLFRRGGERLGLWPGPSGLVVVDIDVKDGAFGEEEWADLTRGQYDQGPQVLTPSGGRHLYFSKPRDLTLNNTKLSPSIDIRADGGYVLFPTPGSGYEWEVSYPYWCLLCEVGHHVLSRAPVFPPVLLDTLKKVRDQETAPADPNEKIPTGARQDTLFRAGMKARASGASAEGIEAIIRDLNNNRCDPKLSEYRIKDLMRGIMNQSMDYPFKPDLAARRKRSEQPVVPLNWQETFAKPTERVGWLPGLEGLAIEGRITNLYGPAGTGKSELMLNRAAEAGKLGVKVLWLDREMTEEDAKERLEDMGYKAEDLENLIYFLYPPLPWLDTEQGGDDLVEMAKMYEADLVVLDSLSKFVKGDEQDSSTATNFYVFSMLALKEEGIASVTIDHTGKDITRGARGTSAKKDNVDLYMEITRITGVGSRLTTGKQRHSWVRPQYTYRRFTDPIRYSVNTLCVFCGQPASFQTGDYYLCDEHLTSDAPPATLIEDKK